MGLVALFALFECLSRNHSILSFVRSLRLIAITEEMGQVIQAARRRHMDQAHVLNGHLFRVAKNTVLIKSMTKEQYVSERLLNCHFRH